MRHFNRFARKAAIAALLACTAIASPVLAKDWRGWNIHAPEYPNGVALEQFAKEVTDKTEGRITATVYHNAVLGDQPDAIEQTRNGALDFGNFNMGPMGPIVPETNVLSLPFVFSSVDHMHKVMDGEVGKELSDAMAKQGLVSLAWFDSGARSLYNSKKPIEKPDDVQGMKVRVMNNQLYVDMIAALGGNATPMAMGEVYQSLKTGVVDAAENNYPSYESFNHYEAGGFYSTTEHLIIPECVCISTASWEALTPEDQEIVRQAAISAAEKQRELWAAQEKKSRDLVESKGAKVNEIADKSAFQDAMKPVYEKFFVDNPSLKPLVEKIQATK